MCFFKRIFLIIIKTHKQEEKKNRKNVYNEKMYTLYILNHFKDAYKKFFEIEHHEFTHVHK